MDLKVIFLLGVLVTNLPTEPPEQYLVSEEIDTVVGFYFRNYAVLSDRINYRTARQIVTIAQDHLDGYYVDANQYPLFYWFDANGDGDLNDPGEMFIDREMHGCGCDIKPYQTSRYASGNSDQITVKP